MLTHRSNEATAKDHRAVSVAATECDFTRVRMA